jgi:hypothetical protein
VAGISAMSYRIPEFFEVRRGRGFEQAVLPELLPPIGKSASWLYFFPPANSLLRRTIALFQPSTALETRPLLK